MFEGEPWGVNIHACLHVTPWHQSIAMCLRVVLNVVSVTSNSHFKAVKSFLYTKIYSNPSRNKHNWLLPHLFNPNHSIQSLTFRCILQGLRGSQACRTCPAACTAGWNLPCLETAAAERWTEGSWAPLRWPTSPIPSGFPRESCGYCCWPWGYTTPNRKHQKQTLERLDEVHWVGGKQTEAREEAFNEWTYLTLRCIGHAPHCCNNRQRPRGLVGVLLPGDWVIGKGSITAKQIKTHMCLMFKLWMTLIGQNISWWTERENYDKFLWASRLQLDFFSTLT